MFTLTDVPDVFICCGGGGGTVVVIVIVVYAYGGESKIVLVT